MLIVVIAKLLAHAGIDDLNEKTERSTTASTSTR